MNETVPHPSMLRLGWTFFKIGATAFGGLGATLAIIHRELVDRQRLLTAEQMTEALAFTKPLPGSTVVQVVSYLGYRLGGWHGSALVTAAFLTPPLLAMLAVAGAYGAIQEMPDFAAVVNGLVAAVAGLMAATTWKLGKVSARGALPILIAASAFAAAFALDANAAVIVLVAGTIGLATLSPSTSSR